MSDPFASLSEADRAKLRAAKRPEQVTPMKALLTDERFSDPDWVYERKLDGIRCIAIKAERRVTLLSRNDLSLTGRFGEVAAALEADPVADVVLDGEVVAFDGAQTSFARLQQRDDGRRPRAPSSTSSTCSTSPGRTPPRCRGGRARALLRSALAFEGPIRLTPHRNRDGEALYAEACRKGWEGVIAKRADAAYVHGRSKDWLKFKCSAEQELVIGGFTAPKGARTDLGALLLGVFDGDELRYAGKVGTGFTQGTLRDLAARLTPLHRDDSPFAERVREPRVTWVEPRLVAQVGFSEWTRDGRLRHPRFLGLRDDKPAREVVRER